MRLPHYILIGAMLSIGCNGCKKEDDDPPPMPAAPTVSETAAPEPAVLTTAEPAAPGEVVRPELDNREDGGTGNLLAISGAKANVKMPSDWKVEKGTNTVAKSADGKLRLVFKSGTDATAEMDAMASAAGVSGCTWQGPITVTVGKDKLSANAADGKCANKPAAFMATEGLIAFASWDDDADRTPLFSILRSVAKPVAGGPSVSRLVACCRVLAQNAKSAPPMQQPFMLQAAATCEAAARNNNVGAVNAALSQFGMKCN